MDHSSDGIDEAFEGALRVMLTAAGRAGEQLARDRERAARDAQAASQQRAAELSNRITAEREAAKASLSTVYREAWWLTASPEDIARQYQTSTAWADVEPEAVRAEQHIASELRRRYGVDLDSRAGDPGAVRDAMHQAERARDDAGRAEAGGRRDLAEGAQLIAQADAADRRAEQEALGLDSPDRGAEVEELEQRAEVAYDSAERRQAMAEELRGVASQAEVAARVRADVSQALPAAEATRGAGRRPAKARRARGGQQQLQRPGLTR